MTPHALLADTIIVWIRITVTTWVSSGIAVALTGAIYDAITFALAGGVIISAICVAHSAIIAVTARQFRHFNNITVARGDDFAFNPFDFTLRIHSSVR